MMMTPIKPIKPISLLLFLLLLAGCGTMQQSEKTRLVSQAIDSRRLTVEVSTMNTLRYGSHRVASDFSLTLRGDTLVSYLPFFGVAHSAPMFSPSQGLNFTSAITNFRQTAIKHDGVRMTMDVASDEDRFEYQLDIFPDGTTYINVRPRDRDWVSFNGYLSFQ